MITAFGMLVLPICLFCVNSAPRLLSLVFLCSAFMAAAVLVFGGYGVTPGLVPSGMFIVIFLLRTVFGARFPAERLAVHVLFPFILVFIWALVSSVIMPRLFQNEIFVWPQKLASFIVITPLAPNIGNFTQDAYLAAAAALAICASIYLTQNALPLRRLFDAYLAAGMLVVFVSLWQFAGNMTGLWFPKSFFLSNPGWSILTEESIGSLIRITGPCSEPAELASYLCGIIGASGWIVLNGDKGLWPRIVFGSALSVLLLSTSATGYAALVILAGIVANYAILFGTTQLRKNVVFLASVIFVFGALSFVIVPVVAPNVAKSAGIIISATLDKNQSSSYNDRTGADIDSIHAMEASDGLGVGWGSNRSSSLLPGLLASVGVFGVAGLFWFAFRIAVHVRAAHRLMPPAELRTVLHGCTGGIVGTLAAAAISAPTITSPDFYLLIALLIGTAAGIRQHSRTVATQSAVREAVSKDKKSVAKIPGLAGAGYRAWRV